MSLSLSLVLTTGFERDRLVAPTGPLEINHEFHKAIEFSLVSARLSRWLPAWLPFGFELITATPRR